MEHNWGIFYSTGTPVYNIDLSAGDQCSNRNCTNNNSNSSAPGPASPPPPASIAAPPASAPPPTSVAAPPSTLHQWCVAKTEPEISTSALQEALNYYY